MKKYNFFDLKTDVKTGKKLPEDVNKPIHDFLISNGLSSVSKILKKKEQKTQCGDLTVVSIKNPAVRIELKTNYGMVEGYDTVAESLDNCFAIVDRTHIKNTNLDMSKIKEDKFDISILYEIISIVAPDSNGQLQNRLEDCLKIIKHKFKKERGSKC